MIAFICLFFPAVIGVWFFEHLHKTPLSRRQWLYRYCACTILTNALCFAIKRFLLDTGFVPLSGVSSDMTPSAGLNYLVMATPIAIIIGLLQAIFSKHATITIEEQEDA